MRLVRTRFGMGTSVAVIAAAAALVWISVTPAAGARRLHFFARYSELQDADVDHNGDGDPLDLAEYEAGSFKLRQDGEGAGHFDFQCMHTHVDPVRDFCIGTMRVAGKGLITAQNVQSESSNRANAAITGGTGAFRGASGALHLFFERSGVRLTVILD